jgi:hypothetical protein
MLSFWPQADFWDMDPLLANSSFENLLVISRTSSCHDMLSNPVILLRVLIDCQRNLTSPGPSRQLRNCAEGYNRKCMLGPGIVSTPIILPCGWLRQEGHDFKASLGCIVRGYLKNEQRQCMFHCSNWRLEVTQRLTDWKRYCHHSACRIFQNSFLNDFIIALWQPNQKYH